MADHARAIRPAAARAAAAAGGVGASPLAERLNASPAVARLATIADGLAPPVQRRANRTGLPDALKAGVERLSGLAMDDVRVHRNSSQPSQLSAHAFARGTEIHLAPGQDRHLPHEAWHVAQQKQGRVRATGQVKGQSLNDDAGLEREADTMGARAAQLQRRAIEATVQPLPRTPVIQGRLFRGADEVELPRDNGRVSRIVRSLIESPVEYVLRDDCALTDPAVHTLRRDRKYLLGEEHGTRAWGQRTAGWPVDTMVEREKAFPEDDTTHAPGDARREDQALESIHAYTLAVVLKWQEWVEQWTDIWKSWIDEQRGILPELNEDDLASVGMTMDDIATDSEEEDEDAPLHAPPDAAPITEPQSGGALAFAQVQTQGLQLLEMRRRYMLRPRDNDPNAPANLIADRLEALGDTITGVIRRATGLMHAPPNTRVGAVERALALIHADVRSVVVRVGTRTFLAVKQDAQGDEARIKSLIKGEAPGSGNTLTTTNPYREAAMMRNITAARAPLLVKIGNEHVARVAAGVPNAVAVPIGHDFDRMTRQPGGEEADPRAYLAMGIGALMTGAGILVGGTTRLGGGLIAGGLATAGLAFHNRNRQTSGELA